MSRVIKKPAFCICENKDADQLAVKAKLISAFVFATRIVQSLYFLNPKFQVSSHLLWLYSPVCIGPGRKPRKRFSQNEAQMIIEECHLSILHRNISCRYSLEAPHEDPSSEYHAGRSACLLFVAKIV